MVILRIDETSEGGKVFADWMREELLALGNPGKDRDLIAFGKCRAYVAVDPDGDEIAGRNEPRVFDTREILVDGKEATAAPAEIEAYLRDRKGYTAIVYHTDFAVLPTFPFDVAFHSRHNGNFGVRVALAYAHKKAEEANGERAQRRRGGDGRQHEVQVHDWTLYKTARES